MKTLILIALCLLFVGISSCSPSHEKALSADAEKTAEYWFNLGEDYRDAEKYDDAIGAYKKAIETKPDYAEAYFNLGVAYGEFGKYQEAIDTYKQAIRIEPDFAGTYYNLGVAYAALDMYQEAIEAYKQAIKIAPYFGAAYHNLGYTYDELGKYQKVIDTYKQVIRIQPDNADAHYSLGVTYDKLGMDKESIEAYKQTIRINPEHFRAHHNLGFAYYRLGIYKNAIKAFERASETGYREAINEIAWILSTCPDDDIRDGQRAIDIMKPIISKGEKDPSKIDTLAAAYAEVGMFSEAIKLMHEAIEKIDRNKELELYKDLQLRLESYKNSKPWRE